MQDFFKYSFLKNIKLWTVISRIKNLDKEECEKYNNVRLNKKGDLNL